MTDPSVLGPGSNLIVGPSGAGKTRLTASALEAWIDRRGPDGVVVFDFGPEMEHRGRILGRRLSRFTSIPDDAWCGVLDAHAPRAQSDCEENALSLAADNARRAQRLFETAPAEPRAVFVNDATIPFQSDDIDPHTLTRYCDRAEMAVLNAFESDELGVGDPVSRNERAALSAFREWADPVVELDGQEGGP